jgi:hypothetical protein
LPPLLVTLLLLLMVVPLLVLLTLLVLVLLLVVLVTLPLEALLPLPLTEQVVPRLAVGHHHQPQMRCRLWHSGAALHRCCRHLRKPPHIAGMRQSAC